MRISLKVATMAIALAGTSLAGLGVANADGDFDIGVVAVGYADGYMGTDHQFHEWEHRADAEAYRAKKADQYRAWKHDDPRHHDDH